MRLVPYPKPAMRWLKICKHVYNLAERWWEVFGDHRQWHADWNLLRTHGCFNGEDAHLKIGRAAATLDVAERQHGAWLDAAEKACDQALAAQRVFATDAPHKRCYVGDLGVSVYVAEGHLVTCFRPRVAVGRGASGGAEVAAQHAQARAAGPRIRRAGVRRSQRRASLDPKDNP